jgi:hypothetical protein
MLALIGEVLRFADEVLGVLREVFESDRRFTGHEGMGE